MPGPTPPATSSFTCITGADGGPLHLAANSAFACVGAPCPAGTVPMGVQCYTTNVYGALVAPPYIASLAVNAANAPVCVVAMPAGYATAYAQRVTVLAQCRP